MFNTPCGSFNSLFIAINASTKPLKKASLIRKEETPINNEMLIESIPSGFRGSKEKERCGKKSSKNPRKQSVTSQSIGRIYREKWRYTVVGLIVIQTMRERERREEHGENDYGEMRWTGGMRRERWGP